MTQQGWHTKYPALGCHKRAFALRDLVSCRALPRCVRDLVQPERLLTVVRALRSSWPGQAGTGTQVDADRPGCHGREAVTIRGIRLSGGAHAGQKAAPGLPVPSHVCLGPPTQSFMFAAFAPTRYSPAETASSELWHPWVWSQGHGQGVRKPTWSRSHLPVSLL